MLSEELPTENALDMQAIRANLQEMKFQTIFIERLNWNKPDDATLVNVPDAIPPYRRQEIAKVGGVPIFEITMPGGKIPDAKQRKEIHNHISAYYTENLLIFLDEDQEIGKERTQSLWYWVKRDGGKRIPREHAYFKGQPGDLSLGKLEAMLIDASKLDRAGDASVVEAIQKLQKAMDVERVTKRFYEEYNVEHLNFEGYIKGIEDAHDQRWYASVMMNRLMFVYFMQRKGFIDPGNPEKRNYLKKKLEESKSRKQDEYYEKFLKPLFFEGFAKKERTEENKKLLGEIIYLKGGMFLHHKLEQKWPNIKIADEAFFRLFKLLDGFTWNLDDTPGGKDNEISPHILGYIFEKYINRKSSGAYYTRPQITDYLCERTIYGLILDKIKSLNYPMKRYDFQTAEELLFNLDATLCRELLNILPEISLLDPACGSGAFLVSALNTLINVYSAIIGKITILSDSMLTEWLRKATEGHKSLSYYIKRKIITENLFGVDIDDEAVEIARLRLFLALVASVEEYDQLEPLPNIDFNVLYGNSLIGILHVNEEAFEKKAVYTSGLFYQSFSDLAKERDELIHEYQEGSGNAAELEEKRDKILQHAKQAIPQLNDHLLTIFNSMKVKFEEAIWDDTNNCEGPTKKRALQLKDVEAFKPFHWGFEFRKVMKRGGFDIIITNPPWEGFKPQAKEFFARYSITKMISKNKMRLEDFEAERDEILKTPKTRQLWLEYKSSFPSQSAIFRSLPEYRNQISIVDGRRAGTDVNLYKVFTERCFNLLRPGGLCGIVLAGGIYSDKGTKQLREMLFDQTEIMGLFGFENRQGIFEEVHRSFKFVVLTFKKKEKTIEFPAAFMHRDPDDLEHFPQPESLKLPVELIRRLSPDTLSMLEFNSELDISIVEKIQRHPTLDDRFAAGWTFELANEFHMTNDHPFFENSPGPDRLPLYEGKMIHQFTHQWNDPRYWVEESRGRRALARQEISRAEADLYKVADDEGFHSIAHTRHERVEAFLKSLGVAPITQADVGIAPDAPRLAFRDIARNTDERTIIATILPQAVFAGNTLNYVKQWVLDASKVLTRPARVKECYSLALSASTLAYLCGVFNSFTLDYLVRFRVNTHVNMFYCYQLPVPRLPEEDHYFMMIVKRVCQLVCTTSDFQGLWESIFPDIPWSADKAITNVDERAKLRAEIDGLVAHLYDLNEKEFEHVLSTFPLVQETVKLAALNAYKDFSPSSGDVRVACLIDQGEESGKVEFKVAACWNTFNRVRDERMKNNILWAVASFLNSWKGGTVIIGVNDVTKQVVGLTDDYRAANPQTQDRNGYLLFLKDALRSGLSGEWTELCDFSFSIQKRREVCVIDVKPSPDKPIFVKGGDLYIREVNAKRKLTAEQAVEYKEKRWGK